MGKDELELVANIGQIWSNLFAESRQVDQSLKDVRETFSKVRESVVLIILSNVKQSMFTVVKPSDLF